MTVPNIDRKRNLLELDKFVQTTGGTAIRTLLTGSNIDLTIGSLGIDVSAFADSSGNIRDALVDDSNHQYTHITDTSGTVIAMLDMSKASAGTLQFNAAFSNGLTIVTSSTAKITVIYE